MSFSSLLRKKTRPFCSAVIVAAGSSERMGEDKLMLELGGMPILVRTLNAFEACGYIDEVIVVTRQEKLMDVAKLCREYGIDKASKILCGGVNRPESALIGVCGISPEADLVAIHDGARPFVTEEIIQDTVHMASLNKAAAPAVSVKDTVKLTRENTVKETPDRETVKAVQTPQVFFPDIIKASLSYAVQNDLKITDDCSAVEFLGVPVTLTKGSEENIKITTPLDLIFAKGILESRGEVSCE